MKTRGGQRIARLGLLASASLILFALESLAPRPLPWMKLGLGNVAVVLALLLYGPASAFAVSLVKLLGGGLVTGGIGSPGFAIATAAGLGSLTAMSLAHRAAPTVFSPIGLSVLGAVVHQVCQLVAAYAYVQHAGLFSLLPLFLVIGELTGALTGLVAYWVWRQLGSAVEGPGGGPIGDP